MGNKEKKSVKAVEGVTCAVRMDVYIPPSFTMPKTIYTINNSTKGTVGIDEPEH